MTQDITDKDFQHRVIESEIPILVDFWAPWCGICRALSTTLDSLAKAYSGKALVLKLNVDDNPNTAMRYRIRSVPTFIIFKEGEEKYRILGHTLKKDLAEKFDALI